VKPGSPVPAAETRVAAAEAAAGMAATEEKASIFQDIRFDFDKSFIREDAKPTLAKIADYMKKNAGAKLSIEGYCDERGTAEYNMALGDRRANSAKKYLVSLGVPAGALSTISFGKEKPLDPGHTEEAWAKNRRAHFVLK
jgi:peptidoglycan-associated lipoprotein